MMVDMAPLIERCQGSPHINPSPAFKSSTLAWWASPLGALLARGLKVD